MTGSVDATVVVVCGWCRRVRVAPNRWTEVEKAIEILRIFDLQGVPRLSHGICELCADLLRGRAGI
jgi:hypothetical protein